MGKTTSEIIKIMIVVGARPNFIKVAPLFWELKNHPNIKPFLVHTGQHYDFEMSQVFFRDLDIPKPDYNLGIGSGPHGAQTGQILIELEKVIFKEEPDAVVVIGDVNSTLAGALAAAKLHVFVAHIEAGLRSYNKSMPEEINRILTDQISDLLFCPTETAVKNLKKEGITNGVINTGDIMLDILMAKAGDENSMLLDKLPVEQKNYLLLTIHRASNTDNLDNLKKIVETVLQIGEKVIFPVHPRTKLKLEEAGLIPKIVRKKNFLMIEPAGYLEMLSLERNAKKILTDSGGIQKEAFWLGVPCITLRDETEWKETTNGNWNILAGTDRKKIMDALFRTDPKRARGNYYGDGHAAKKMVAGLIRKINCSAA